jgi:hypothetical protein
MLKALAQYHFTIGVLRHPEQAPVQLAGVIDQSGISQTFSGKETGCLSPGVQADAI